MFAGFDSAEERIDENHVRFEPDDWCGKRAFIDRGVDCLRHLIRKEFTDGIVRVLEVGAVDPYFMVERNRPEDYEFEPCPISVLTRRVDRVVSAVVGPVGDLNERHKRQIFRDANCVEGFLVESSFCWDDATWPSDVHQQILEVLGGPPDIVYGQHVFENSDASFESFPMGQGQPVYGAAEILADGGFLVIDNASGHIERIWLDWRHEHVGKLSFTYSYMYGSKSDGELHDRGIYVFQKKA